MIKIPYINKKPTNKSSIKKNSIFKNKINDNSVPVGRTVMVRNGHINKKTDDPEGCRTHVVIATNVYR